MKKIISLLLAALIVFSTISFSAFAKYEDDGYIFYEDFEDYKAEDTLPDGFSWGSIGADCKVSSQTAAFK